MTTTRRRLLTASLVAGLGGVFSGCSTGTTRPDTSSATPARPYAITASYEVPAGEYRALALDIDAPSVIDYTADVRAGPNIDVFVLTRDAFREYQRGGSFEVRRDASTPDTSYGQIRTALPPVDVTVVIDNTDAGTARPPESGGTATVEFALTVTDRPR